jgi:hypothetical protein
LPCRRQTTVFFCHLLAIFYAESQIFTAVQDRLKKQKAESKKRKALPAVELIFLVIF